MEVFRALGALIEAPTPEHGAIAAALGLPAPPAPAVYASVLTFQRYPLASVYLGPEGMLGGDARDRIAGLWRVLKLDVPEEPDHISALFGLVSAIGTAVAKAEEKSDVNEAEVGFWTRACETTVHEHLIPWTTLFLETFQTCGHPYYEQWAQMADQALQSLSQELGGPRVPDWLGEAEGLLDPRDAATSEDLLAQLLAPSRTGFVLLRDDLVRAAKELDLAMRAGERRYVLRALFSQEPEATLSWLAVFAGEWAERLGAREGAGLIIGYWRDRALASQRLLASLSGEPAGWGAAGSPSTPTFSGPLPDLV